MYFLTKRVFLAFQIVPSPGVGMGQCDQKIFFFQFANQRCQNRQKIANIFRKLFEIARILRQNRHLNPGFFVFYCIFINKIFLRAKSLCIFFQKN